MLLTALSLMMPFSAYIAKYLGTKLQCYITCLVLSGCVFASSFTTNFFLFTFLYGFCFGFATGLSYLIPIDIAYKYFPNNKGLFSGIIFAGFGLGAFVFNFVVQALVNPDNVAPVKGLFPPEVANRVPHCIRILALIYFGLSVVGASLIINPDKIKEDQNESQAQSNTSDLLNEEAAKEDAEQDAEITQCEDLKTGLSQPKLYIIVVMVVLISGIGVLFSGNQKAYGQEKIDNDKFLTLVGSISSVGNCLARIAWGILSDKFPFKYVILANLTLTMILTITMQFVNGIKILYLIWVFLVFFCFGGNLPDTLLQLSLPAWLARLSQSC